MLKLELDWAADERPVETPYEGEPMRVEFDEKPGPAGWPTVRVYAWPAEGEEEYMAGMRIVGWLKDVYGADEDEADELGGMAETV